MPGASASLIGHHLRRAGSLHSPCGPPLAAALPQADAATAVLTSHNHRPEPVGHCGCVFLWTSVRHVIALIIANTFWAARATPLVAKSQQRLRAVPAAQLAGTGRAPAEYGARSRRRRAMAIYGWGPTKARPASMVSASRSSTRATRPVSVIRLVTSLLGLATEISGWAPSGAACRDSPAASSRSTPCRDGLTSDFVWCLFEDQAATLWIGTEAAASIAFSAGRFTRYTAADGLPSDFVRAVYRRRWERLACWSARTGGISEDRQRSRQPV